MPNIKLSTRRNTIKIKANGPRGLPGAGIVSGGTTGQVLTKQSNANFDTVWSTPPGALVISVNGETGAVVLSNTDIGLGNLTNDLQLKASDLDTDVTLFANSDTKIPSQRAVKTYVDAQITSVTIPDASASTKGKIQLAGDLSGTASSPTVVSTSLTSPLPLAQGGTAASSAATARSSLGLAIGTDIQAFDADLSAIAVLNPTNDDVLQRKAGSWINRSPSQLKADLTLTKADVGLGAVDNVADLDKPISTLTQVALDTKEPTITAGSASQYWRGDKTWQTLNKSAVGLANVDNTSDSSKPVSTATQAALDLKQPLDSDLTAIAALAPTNDDIIQRKAGVWANRTPAQVKTDLVLTKSDVGLSNVPNTDATLRSNHTGTQTASTISDFSTAADARISNSVGTVTQAFDADLGAIAGLTPTNDDILQRKAGAWTNRTPSQIKTDLAITKSDVGLGNVPNTDATLRSNHTGTQLASTISDFDTQVRTSRLDQMAAPNTDVSLNSHKLTGVADPTTDQDAVNKAYVDSIAQGLDIKTSIRAATTGNITLSGEQTIDGIAVVTGDRVLVKDQSSGSQNGIYTVSSSAWARSTDADTGSELEAGAFAFVNEGTLNANSGWVQTTPGTITLNTTALVFTQFSGAGQITAGMGMTKTGDTLDVGAGTGITVGADTISVDSTVYRQGSTDVAVSDGGTGASSAATARTNLGVAVGTDVQAFDTTLTSFAAYNTNGLLTQTAADTFTGRTLTAGSAKLTVTNGSGVGGNPTLDVADATVSQAGAVQLVNDLSGTASAPTVVATHLTSALPIAQGGTAAITASAARTALGLAIGSDIQAYDTTLAALASYNIDGILTQTGADTFTGRTLTAGSSKISISNGSGAAGNPTIDVVEANINRNSLGGGVLTVANGGTGQATAAASFDALSPNTTLGDISYRNGAGNVRLAGNTTTTKNFLTQTGTGSVSAAPSWGAIAAGDVPNLESLNTSTGLTVAKGGTGAMTASGARTNLGLAIGTDIQAFDDDLSALAALSTTGLLSRTATGTFATRLLTAGTTKVVISNSGGLAGNPTIDIADATAAQSGTIQLANDLGGTAASPEVKSRTVYTVGATTGDYPVSGYANFRAALLAAMTAAQAIAAEVYIKPGTYDLSSQLVFHDLSNVTVRGAGSGRTIIRRTFTGGASMLDIGSGVGPVVSNNITFSDLTIDQNNIGSGWGLVVSWCTNVLIENIKFINQNTTSLAALLIGKFGGGSDVYEGHTIRVVNCIFDYSTAASLDWEIISCVNGRNVVFDKCTWKGVAEAWPGLTVYNTEQCTITNSFVDHSKLIIGGRGTYSVLNTKFEQSYLYLDQVKNIYIGAGTTFYTWGTTTGFTNGIEFNGGYKTGGDAETPWYIINTAFATTDVDTTADTITLSSTSYPTGTVVRVSSPGTVPGGLSEGVDYYVININSTTIKLATSLVNATGGTAIDLTSQGTGTQKITVSTIFNCENVVIDGVIFKGAKPNAIRAKTSTEAGKEVLDCRDLTITNCKIEDCTGIPIIAFAETVTITNNEIRNGNTDNAAGTAYHFYVAGENVLIADNYAQSANVTSDVVVDHTRFTTLLPTMNLSLDRNVLSATNKVRYFNSGGSLQSTPTAEVTVLGLPVSEGGTGGTTAATGLNNLLPTQTSNSGKVLQTDGTNASWQTPSGGGGGAPTTSQYITLATDATLTNERVLTGTANQVTVTDGGAGAAVTLSLPQSIHTGASPTFAGLTLSNFTNANHNHTNAAGGGQLTDAALSAAVSVAKGGTGQVTLGSGNVLIGAGTSAVTSSKAAPSGDFIGTIDTQTLTNKRINPRVVPVTSSTTPTPNADTTDQYELTALAGNPTFGAPTGTPVDGQPLIIRIKDNGTARTLTWNAAYINSGVAALPGTTVINKTHVVGFIYDSTAAVWACMAADPVGY